MLVLSILNYEIRVLLEASWQTTKNFSQCSRCSGRLPNFLHSEYVFEALRLVPTF